MNKKVALFAFNGELMCFAHVLLNGLDYYNKGYDVKIIIEGTATKLIKKLDNPETPFHDKYMEAINLGLIDCICKACSKKMGTYSYAEKKGLPIKGEMSGHPSMEFYTNQGYEIITF